MGVVEYSFFICATRIDAVARIFNHEDVALVRGDYIDFLVNLFAHGVGLSHVFGVGVIEDDDSAAQCRRRYQDGRYVVVHEVVEELLKVIACLVINSSGDLFSSPGREHLVD